MKHRYPAVRYLWLSQLSLYGFLLVCTVLMPRFLLERNEGGVSNYGVHALTIVPYSLAFGLGGFFLLAAARAIPANMKSIRIVLSVLGCALLLVLLTTYPYKINRLFDSLHVMASIAYFVAELLAAAWFVVRLVSDRTNGILLGIQIVGSSLSLLTLMDVLHVLFISQFIVGTAFGALLIRTIARTLDMSTKRQTKIDA